MKPRILLVEDNAQLGYILREYLTLKDLWVHWEQDGQKALEVFEQEAFDLCILDIMMPGIDGFELARRFKVRQPQVPLIFLTAKSLKIDVLKGFQLGADDFIIKPVDEEELEARIRAVLRRTELQTGPSGLYQLGQYVFTPDTRELAFGGEIRRLTQRETEVLQLLCRHQGKLTSRDLLLKSVWGKNDYFSRKSMDVFIFKLRKYLEGESRVQIVNVHGRGYILQVEG